MSNITLYVDVIISLPNYFANLLRQSLYNICDLLNISVAFAFPFMTLFFLSTKTFGFMNEACSKRENHEKLQVQLLDFKKNAFQNLVPKFISWHLFVLFQARHSKYNFIYNTYTITLLVSFCTVTLCKAYNAESNIAYTWAIPSESLERLVYCKI